MLLTAKTAVSLIDFKNCLPPVSLRLPWATGDQFRLFYWPTSVISSVMVCAPSCPNWRTSPESTDSSAGTRPLPRQDVIAFCFCIFFMGHKYCFTSRPHSSIFSLRANSTVCVDALPFSRLLSHTLLFWYSVALFFKIGIYPIVPLFKDVDSALCCQLCPLHSSFSLLCRTVKWYDGKNFLLWKGLSQLFSGSLSIVLPLVTLKFNVKNNKWFLMLASK